MVRNWAIFFHSKVVIYPRCACARRLQYLICVSVCLSVCLSPLLLGNGRLIHRSEGKILCRYKIQFSVVHTEPVGPILLTDKDCRTGPQAAGWLDHM